MESNQLRDTLFRALEQGDFLRFEQLVAERRQEIVQNFPEWRRVPAEVRGDQVESNRYVQGLMGLSRFFADRLGDQSLVEILSNAANNPLKGWEQRLQQAARMMEQLRYAEAGEMLRQLMSEFQNHQGSAVVQFLILTLGHLGECYYNVGAPEVACDTWNQAMDWCSRNQDIEGWFGFGGMIIEGLRYQGRGEDAARYAESLAAGYERQGSHEQAKVLRHRAETFRRGEPLVRVIGMIDGRRMELDRLPPPGAGRDVKFLFERNRPSPRGNLVRTRLGEQLAVDGKLEQALDHFRLASAADPYDPHSHYQAALTLALLDRAKEAVVEYDRTEELAPGWHACRHERWFAQQIATKKIEVDFLILIRQLEDGNEPLEEKLETVDLAISEQPKFAPLYFQKGKLLAKAGEARKAETAFRKAFDLCRDDDLKTQVVLALGEVVERPDERKQCLETASNLHGNLLAAAKANWLLRAI